jgi:hypothetical protein
MKFTLLSSAARAFATRERGIFHLGLSNGCGANPGEKPPRTELWSNAARSEPGPEIHRRRKIVFVLFTSVAISC